MVTPFGPPTPRFSRRSAKSNRFSRSYERSVASRTFASTWKRLLWPHRTRRLSSQDGERRYVPQQGRAVQGQLAPKSKHSPRLSNGLSAFGLPDRRGFSNDQSPSVDLFSGDRRINPSAFIVSYRPKAFVNRTDNRHIYGLSLRISQTNGVAEMQDRAYRWPGPKWG